MDFLKNIAASTPKMILGSRGKYFRIATAENYELYVKLAFNLEKVFSTSGALAKAFVCETNLLLVPLNDCPPPELKEPLAWDRDGVYLDNGKKVQGFLVAKLWMPTPITTLDITLMFGYLTTHQEVIRSYLDENAVKPLGCSWCLPFEELLVLLSDDIKLSDFEVPVKIYTKQQFIKEYQALAVDTEKKFDKAGSDHSAEDDGSGE